MSIHLLLKGACLPAVQVCYCRLGKPGAALAENTPFEAPGAVRQSVREHLVCSCVRLFRGILVACQIADNCIEANLQSSQCIERLAVEADCVFFGPQVVQSDPRVLALVEHLAEGPLPDWDPPPALLVLNKACALLVEPLSHPPHRWPGCRKRPVCKCLSGCLLFM